MNSPARRSIVAVTVLAFLLTGGCALHARQDAQTESKSASPLAGALDQALRRGKTGKAFYSARVIDLRSGQELYAVDPDKPMIPASNGKLAPSAATLDLLGSKHVFKTYLAVDGDDLWLIGTGDPGTGDDNLAKRSGGSTMTLLDQFADALEKRGIKTIKGNLCYYDRVFDDEWIHPTWSKSYITDWYAAPVAGLNFNNNCVDIAVKPTSDGQPVMYTVIPPTQDVRVNNEMKTGRGREGDVERDLDRNVFTIKGATTRPTTMKSEAVVDPGAFFADALRTHLEKRGIKVDGKTIRAEEPLGGKVEPPAGKTVMVAETKLPDALGRINKQSQNNFAEAFCKYLGRAYWAKQGQDERGSWPGGAEATMQFLRRNGIDTSKIEIVDGSGLSRNNRVTTRMISDLLVVMSKHPEHKTFYDSMTISGEDGTIRNRLKDLKGRVHAKTGFIGGVRSLSGYVTHDDGHMIVFSIVFNGIEGSVTPYENMQDDAVRVLAAWPKKPPATQPATRAVARL